MSYSLTPLEFQPAFPYFSLSFSTRGSSSSSAVGGGGIYHINSYLPFLFLVSPFLSFFTRGLAVGTIMAGM